MDFDNKSLEEILSDLSPVSRAKVRALAETLLLSEHHKSGRLQQNWAGTLSEYREKYTSMDLQRKSVEWRNA